MDISSIARLTGTYQYANQIANRNVTASDFVGALSGASTGNNEVDAYKQHLQEKFGVPIMVSSIGSDQNSMDRLGAGTSGTGNVVIAPNILEQMANDPEKAAKYEKIIQSHFDSLPATEAFMASIGHKITSCGVVIHEDGMAHYYLSGEEGPEIKARFEAAQKEKQERKAKAKRETEEHLKEAAEERAQLRERMYRQRSLEEMLHTQMSQNGSTSFAREIQMLDVAYLSGIASTNILPSVSADISY